MKFHKILNPFLLVFVMALASCSYGGYDFEITDMAYEPFEGVADNGSNTDTERDSDSNSDFENQDNEMESGTTAGSSSGGSRQRTDYGSNEGLLEINVEPENALIIVNGETLASGSTSQLLIPGTYLVEAELEGYAPYVSNIIVNPRSERTKIIKLYPEWLPSEEQLKIESFTVSQSEILQGNSVSLSSLFSGPADAGCDVLVNGVLVSRNENRNIESITSQSFDSIGKQIIELKCEGLETEQSETLTVNVRECISDSDCEFLCNNYLCTTPASEQVGLRVEYFDRFFLWFGNWKEYNNEELKSRSRVRMIVTELPDNTNCSPLGIEINLDENQKSKPFTLRNSANIGVECDDGSKKIVPVKVHVEGGIVGQLME